MDTLNNIFLFRVYRKNVVFEKRKPLMNYPEFDQIKYTANYDEMLEFFYTLYTRKLNTPIEIYFPVAVDNLEVAFIYFKYYEKDWLYIMTLKKYIDIPIIKRIITRVPKFAGIFTIKDVDLKHGTKLSELFTEFIPSQIKFGQ